MYKKIFQLITALILCCSFAAQAQNSGTARDPAHPPISHTDSIRLKGFLDSVDNSLLFSMRRQRFFDSALAIAPWKSYWWQQKAMPLLKQMKYDIGIQYVDSAVQYDNDVHYYLEYWAFVKCIFQKSYRSAITDFNLVRSYNGNRTVMDHSYDFYKGLCYLQLNMLDSSEYFITSGMNDSRSKSGEDRVHYLDWFYLAIVRYEREDYTGAVDCFNNSLKIYPQFSDAKYYKAVCLHQLKQSEKALACMAEAKNDCAQGYTINEDNAAHEQYPYQVKMPAIEGVLKYMQKEKG